MNISVFEFLTLLMVGILGGVAVSELFGYLWHRFVEHKGWLGDSIREAHVHHHLVVYTIERIRRPEYYISSNSWSWYILAALVSALVLSISYVAGQIIGGIAVVVCGALYGRFIVNNFHEAFHIAGHPLAFFDWFRKLRHYHDLHHLVNGNYGIVSMSLDRVFRTFKKQVPQPLRQENIFPGLPEERLSRLREMGFHPSAPFPRSPRKIL